MLILTVLQGPDRGRRFELPDTEPQLIGRSSEALPLSDRTISRRHAELTPDDGRWYINDLRSANGTYVNGVRIAGPTLLRSGDQIRTGATLVVFGRSVGAPREQPVSVAGPEDLESAVEKTVPSNEDSVIMAVPEPNAEAIRQLRVLYELMQVLGSVFDRDVLLERVMDLVFEHFQADRGFVLLQQTADQKPEPAVVRYRRKPRSSDERKITASRTIVQHVVQKGEGVLSSNAMTDKRFGPSDSVQAYGIRSAICVPIKFREKTFGVIHIDSQVANYTFTEDQLRLLTAIGAQTALALENADLYQRDMTRARLAAVGETVASLSHSIRNILQGMRGGAEVVELGIRKSDLNLVGSGWKVLSRNLDRIYDLTLNMLAYSKQRKPEIEMVSLPNLLAELMEMFQPQCDKQDVALITEIGEDVPPVPADSAGLHQALMNLLNNALDAVEPGSGAITVRCEYDDARNEAMIAISDNGTGIEGEAVERLFTPFYSTKGQQGTGLGLAVTKKVIDEHQGRLDVNSEPGVGTTFTIRLGTDLASDPSATHSGQAG